MHPDAAPHLTLTALESGLDRIRESPAGQGRVELVVRRPATDQREILDEGQLDRSPAWSGTPGGTARPSRPASSH